MPTLRMCTCRIECEEIVLADGSRLFVCTTCETYAETDDGRLVGMEEKRLTQKRRAGPTARARSARQA